MISRFRRSLLVVLAITAIWSAGVSSSASAQTVGALELVAQSSWVDDGGIFNAQVRVAGANPASSVSVRVLSPWETRSDLQDQRTEDASTLLEIGPILLADAQETSNAVLPLEIEVGRQTINAQPPVDDEQDVLPLLVTDGDAAVYPLEVVLRDADGEILDQFVTSIIYIPRTDRGLPLATSVLLDTEVGATIDTDGQSTLTASDVERLGIIVDAISQHRANRVSLSITGETLASLSRSDLEGAQAVLDAISEGITAEQLLPQPITRLEEQAWIDAGFVNDLEDLYSRGADITEELTGLRPNTTVAVLDESISDTGLSALQGLGIDGVVVQPQHLTPLDPTVFPEPLTTRFLVPAPGIEPVPAMAIDADLENHFLSPAPVTLAANRFLAELTFLSLQNRDVPAGVVVSAPSGWQPNPAFLNIILSGLERIPTLTGATPQEVLATAAFTPTDGLDSLSPPLRRELTPQDPPTELRSYRAEFSQAQTTIAAWSTVIASDTASVDQLYELLELSTSDDRSAPERSALIEQIYNIIDTQKEGSITTPAFETITLTGRTSDVPVLIDNNLPTDAQVILVLDSEKLDFPEGREVTTVLAPGSNRIEIPIETRGSGDSPIRIQIFSPDRSVLLGSSEILVRAFAFSGVGVLIGALAVAVLLVWWLRHDDTDPDTVDDDLAARPDAEDSGSLIGV